MISRFNLLYVLTLYAACSSLAAATEPTQGMTITGDKELPQVLYITPWKEQSAALPEAPKLPNPIQQPLTPCDTGQTMDDYRSKLWNCSQSSTSTRP